jgi:predicted short-subunit dehydrogenase-like oxidoreductase (DUF2520 family)
MYDTGRKQSGFGAARNQWRRCLGATLNIIGCGKVGRTLARLWADGRYFSVQDIENRSLASAESAVAFIGAGRTVENETELRPAAAWMIAATDDRIAGCCERIAVTGKIQPGNIVFHCSGALNSSVLAAAAECGAAVASAHPVASFAEPEHTVARFAGSYCSLEGDAPALEVLGAAFAGIGGKVLRISADTKIIYHAGAVFASNYLVAVLDAALRAYELSGVPRAIALELMRPLVQGSVDNVFALGTKKALTGPIARGDMELVKNQYAALAASDPSLSLLYGQLAQMTARLAERDLTL